MSTFQQLIDENWSGVQIAGNANGFGNNIYLNEILGFVQKNVHSLNSTKQEAMEWNCSVLEAIHNAIDQYDSDHVSALGGLVTVLGMVLCIYIYFIYMKIVDCEVYDTTE